MGTKGQYLRAVDPLDADLLSNLDVFDQRTSLDDEASTLVPTDKWELGVQWPVTIYGMEITEGRGNQ